MSKLTKFKKSPISRAVTSSPKKQPALELWQLWKRLKKGEKPALEELFRSHYSVLYDYGQKLCGQEEIVKDCIQETFVYIWEKRKTLTTPDSVRAYLLVSLRRRILKVIENQNKRNRIHEQYKTEGALKSFSAEDLLILSEIEASQKKIVSEAFEAIPDRLREALYLKTFTGLPYSKISKIMGISPQVARNYVSEAMQRLREVLVSNPH